MNCRKCNVDLVVGDNWYASWAKRNSYCCIPCVNKTTKKWNKDNPERKRLASKDEYHRLGYQKKQLKKYTLDYWVVYLLPKENYIGVTNNIYYRMANHKTSGKNTSNYKILHKYKLKDKALIKEEEYHNNGYDGRYGYKSEITKQTIY